MQVCVLIGLLIVSMENILIWLNLSIIMHGFLYGIKAGALYICSNLAIPHIVYVCFAIR